MLVWKCIGHDRVSRNGFKYPEVGEVVRESLWVSSRVLFGGLHGCVAGGMSTESIIYRPAGIWLLIEVIGSYVHIGRWHIKFNEGKVVAEFTKFSDLMAHPAMNGQCGVAHWENGDVAVSSWYYFNETGAAQDNLGRHEYVYGLTQAVGLYYLSAGPGGVLQTNQIYFDMAIGAKRMAKIGETLDVDGQIMQPYKWYAWQAPDCWAAFRGE